MEQRPLDGIRVLEFTSYISGPYGGALFATLGADVVKVEPLEGEAFRIGRDAGSPYFAQYNAGKRSIAIDLKSSAGVDAMKALLPRFDVLIENMRPGKLAALGLGPEVCRALNPKLIYTSISGFGNGGPLRDRPAFDSIGQSLGGLYTVMNDDNDVRLTGTCVADLITAISMSIGVLSALVGRSQSATGEGAYLETSVMEGVSTLAIDAMTQAFDGDMDPVRDTRHAQANNFCLKTATGDSITLHLSSSQKFWRALARAVDREDLIEDPRFRSYGDRTKPENYQALKVIMEQQFAKRSRDDWEERLAEADVPFAPALTMRQVAAHEQTKWLEMFDKDDRGHTLVRPPWRIDGKRPTRPRHIPLIGEHTREVLGEVLSAAQLDALSHARIIA
jgi:formyl-CoA transferase